MTKVAQEMSRILFLILLAANIALAAAWLRPAGRADATPYPSKSDTQFDDAPATIKLVDESAEPEAPVSRADESGPGPGEPQVNVATPLSNLDAPDDAQQDGRSDLSGGSPAPAEGNEPTMMPDRLGQQLPDRQEALAQALDAKPPESEARCWSVGPLPDNDAVASLVSLLAQRYDTAVTERKAPVQRTFWVHIPTGGEPDKADGIVTSLTALGVESFVIREKGALENAVSLGVFRDPESASRFRARSEAKTGHTVEVSEMSRSQSAYFVTLSASSSQDATRDEELLAWIRARPGVPQLEVCGAPHEDVASP